jgi:hypothetical protein
MPEIDRTTIAPDLPWPYNGIVRDLTVAVENGCNYLAALGLVCWSEFLGRQIAQADFGALAMDPQDFSSIWVAGGCGPAYAGTAALYKVRTTDGTVLFRCRADVFETAPTGGWGGSHTLALGRSRDFTYIVTKPAVIGGFEPPPNYLYAFEPEKFGESCTPLGIWYVLPDLSAPDLGSNVFPEGAELVGVKNKLIAAADQCTDPSCAALVDGVYNFGPTQPFGSPILTTPTAQVPFAIGTGDIAMGSSF